MVEELLLSLLELLVGPGHYLKGSHQPLESSVVFKAKHWAALWHSRLELRRLWSASHLAAFASPSPMQLEAARGLGLVGSSVAWVSWQEALTSSPLHLQSDTGLKIWNLYSSLEMRQPMQTAVNSQHLEAGCKPGRSAMVKRKWQQCQETILFALHAPSTSHCTNPHLSTLRWKFFWRLKH